MGLHKLTSDIFSQMDLEVDLVLVATRGYGRVKVDSSEPLVRLNLSDLLPGMYVAKVSGEIQSAIRLVISE